MQRTAVEQFTSRNLRGVFAPVWLAQSAPGGRRGGHRSRNQVLREIPRRLRLLGM